MKRAERLLLLLSMFISITSPIKASAVLANPTPSCVGANCTVTFSTTNDYYDWIVPSGITSITVDIKGAKGGNASYYGNTGIGGSGGRVTATLTVTPGATLRMYVGGQGGDNTVGGFNGGGTAQGVTYGGSGGGASDIRVSPYGLNDRIIVAGGGGGSAGGSYTSSGGVGGGGLIGLSPGNCAGSYYGGGGGTQSAGGAAGSGYTATSAGTFGVGGGVANATHTTGGGGGWYGGGGGSVCGGGGGSSYTHPTLASSVTHYQGVNAGTGSIAITYLNAPVPTTFSSSQSTPTNIGTGSTISYSLIVSQSVSDLAVSDFQFGGSSSCNTPGLSGSGTTYTVTLTNCTEGSLILQLKANSITGSAAGPPADNSANTIIIDRTAPSISSVTAPANKTYIPSETPTFTVAFSESMTVTGTPKLTLTVGTSTTKFANFISFSDSKTALFRYTVGTTAGEFDTDGISMIGAIDQISGSFKDLAGNSLSSALFTPPTLTSVLVAQPASAPTITSITPSSTQLSVAFTAGAANGSTTSTYQYSTNNGGSWSTRATGSTGSPLVISGLTDGTGYTIRIRAVTNAGNSDSSTAVTETPTAISVTGDATLVITYGNSGSTSAYSANGGNNSFTWTLGSSISGVTISGTIVTASSSLAAGTYAQSVRATDTSGGIGTKSLTITVNKALTSISIALPNSATSAAASGTVTITATVPRAGTVNFMVGGSTISGCASQSAASTTATCSWTAPGNLGSVTLTAEFTPTDTSNYETSTTSNLTISIVNGVSTVTLSLAGGVTQVPKGQAVVITAVIDQAGKIAFYADGKRIAGCINRVVAAGSRTCSWKPTTQKQVTITVTLNPTNNVYQDSSQSMKVWVVRRTGLRS